MLRRFFQALFILPSIGLIAGCVTTNYGDDQFRLGMATHGKDIMWVPSKIEIVHKMLEAAKVTRNDVIYDLGSGDGVIPIEAAKKYGVRAVGIEYNADLVELAKRNAKRSGVENLVSFKRGDIFVEDFSAATVVALYLGENLNAKLMPTLLKMKPGTRVVSNTFRIESWIPDQQIKISTGEMAYLWIVPASIDGRWAINGIPNVKNAAIEIRQKKQFFDAAVFFDGRRIALIENGQIKGSALTVEFSHANTQHRIQAEVQGSAFVGLWNNDPAVKITANLQRAANKAN